MKESFKVLKERTKKKEKEKEKEKCCQLRVLYSV